MNIDHSKFEVTFNTQSGVTLNTPVYAKVTIKHKESGISHTASGYFSRAHLTKECYRELNKKIDVA